MDGEVRTMTNRGGHWQKIVGQQQSRRSLLTRAALGTAGLSLGLGLACGNRTSKSKGSGPEAGTPQKGGTLRRRSVTDAYQGGFDPHVQAGSQTGEMGFFYQALLRLNPK